MREDIGHEWSTLAAYDAARLGLIAQRTAATDHRAPLAGLHPALQESWQATRLIGALLEHDPTKIIDCFDFGIVPMVSKPHVMVPATGSSWLEKGATVLLFGPPGVGKKRTSAA